VIVEGFVDFDYEITQLTVRHAGGTTYLDPIGHTQEDGDYRESWQPQPMTEAALAESRRIAGAVTEALGGRGVFGVELFVRGDEVLFSEVSPRPHDTGLVTLASQRFSEFALHARAILGLPVHGETCTPAASCAVLAEGSGVPVFHGVADALAMPGTDLRLFGKPRVDGRRRVGVTLARGADVEQARASARAAAAALTIELA
jgi:phosphoribosylglycinamide formyltransferase 2